MNNETDIDMVVVRRITEKVRQAFLCEANTATVNTLLYSNSHAFGHVLNIITAELQSREGAIDGKGEESKEG